MLFRSYEQKNKKDFNKVKDVLEKELKEVRDQSRAFQVAAKNSEMEAQSYQKRVNQLENKVKEVEKEVFAKEDDLKSAQKESQTFKAKISELEKSLAHERSQLEEKKQKINELVERIKGAGQQDLLKQNESRPSPIEQSQNAPGQTVADLTLIADSSDKQEGGQSSAVPQAISEVGLEQVKKGDGIHLAPDRIAQELKKMEKMSMETPSSGEVLDVQEGEQQSEPESEKKIEEGDQNENKNST